MLVLSHCRPGIKGLVWHCISLAMCRPCLHRLPFCSDSCASCSVCFVLRVLASLVLTCVSYRTAIGSRLPGICARPASRGEPNNYLCMSMINCCRFRLRATNISLWSCVCMQIEQNKQVVLFYDSESLCSQSRIYQWEQEEQVVF